MNWADFYFNLGSSPLSWLALPLTLILPFLHARWRTQRKNKGVSGDMAEALSFLIAAVVYFVLAVVLVAIADGLTGNGLEVVLVYLFKAGIPVFLLFMLFRQLIDAYF